jgi:hypothetical protein
MRYAYDDEFLTAGIDEDTLLKYENEAFFEVTQKLNILDEFFVEKLVTAKVYMKIARLNLESDGMRDKFDAYKNEFDFYLKQAKNTNSGISNLSIARS